MQQRFLLRQGFEVELETSCLDFARDEFLEEQRIEREFRGLTSRQHGEKFVAKPEQARGFEPDDRHAMFDVGSKRLEHAPRFGFRFIHQPAREEGAAAA